MFFFTIFLITFLALAFKLAMVAGQSSSLSAQYCPSAQQNQLYSPVQQPAGQSVPSHAAAPLTTFLALAFMPSILKKLSVAGQLSSVAAQCSPSVQQNQLYSPGQQPLGQSVPSQAAAPLTTFFTLTFMLAMSTMLVASGQASSVAAQYCPSEQQNQLVSPIQQPVGH